MADQVVVVVVVVCQASHSSVASLFRNTYIGHRWIFEISLFMRTGQLGTGVPKLRAG